MAAVWVRIQTSLKNTKWATQCKGVANTLHPAKKYTKISLLQDPAQFSTACSALLAFHQSAIRDGQGEHLVFLGEGTSGEVRNREY
jgi:hypothetical protein